MTITDDVLRALRPGPTGSGSAAGALVFDDAGIDRLVDLVNPLEGDALFDAARDLVRLAHFLDAERASPKAAATIITVVAELVPRMQAIDAGRAAALVEQAEGAAAKLSQFSGDERVTTVLDSGARPAGTTPAGPLARFKVQK